MSAQFRVFLKKYNGTIGGRSNAPGITIQAINSMVTVPIFSLSTAAKFKSELVCPISKVNVTPHTGAWETQTLHHTNPEIGFAPESHTITIYIGERQFDYRLVIEPGQWCKYSLGQRWLGRP